MPSTPIKSEAESDHWWDYWNMLHGSHVLKMSLDGRTMTAWSLDRQQRSLQMSSMPLITWKSLGEPAPEWTTWTWRPPPGRELSSWSESTVFSAPPVLAVLVLICCRFLLTARPAETLSAPLSSPVPWWSTSQGEKMPCSSRANKCVSSHLHIARGLF